MDFIVNLKQLVALSWGGIFISIFTLRCSRHSRLRKYNVNLKMKLTDLALKNGNDIYAIYKVSEDDKAKIRELKAQKKKIDAVRSLKENYQMDLFESKTYIDYL